MNRIVACCLASLLPGAFALNASAQTSCTPCNLEFNVPAVPVVEMGCGDGDVLMALPPFPPFTDGCNGDTWNLFFRHSTDWVHTCEVGNGTPAAGAERTMRLVGLTSSGLVTSDLFVVTGAALTWTSFPENVARLQGQVTNLADPNAGFEVDLFFDAQAPADAWVAQGGGLDLGAASGGAEASWVVWSLKPYMSKLLGQGSLAGLQVVLTPSSFDNGYGFQEGANGANLLNAHPGLGGHFDWQFCTGPNTFAGHGTLTAETANCQELNAACGNNPDAVGVYFIGNLTTHDQLEAYVDVVDTSVPAWTSLPPDTTVSCFAEFDAAASGWTAEATDACGTVTVTHTTSFAPGDCPSSGQWEQVWTASNGCGVSIQHVQTVTLLDDVGPTLVLPADVTLSCDAVPTLDAATAYDACDGEVAVVELPSTMLPGSCPQNTTLKRVFEATDACGNTTQGVQLISFVDTTAPVISAPDDMVFGCGSSFPFPTATATDNCSDAADIALSSSTTYTPGDCPAAQLQQRLFTAVDECGNASQLLHTVTVTDIEPPTFTFVPADMDLSCEDSPVLEAATATDACTNVTVTESTVVVPQGCEGNEDWVRTFTATDECGNETSATQLLRFRDTTPPVFAFLPEDVVASCDTPFAPELPEASDACSNVTVTSTIDTLGVPSTGNYTLLHTITAADACGNAVSHVQTVDVVDTEAPVFTWVPESAEVPCQETLVLDDAEAVDNCTAVSVTVSSETVPGACPSEYTLIRTFTATDAAGNAATAIQTLTIVDEEGPVFGHEPEVHLACNASLDEVPLPEVDDACSDWTLEVTETHVSGGCVFPEGQFLREFVATDACGNVTQADQIITLIDDEAPTFVNPPSDVTLECTEGFEVVPPVATDNCSDPSVTWTSDTLLVSPGLTSIEITYTAADDCGNHTTTSHVVQLVDTTGPAWVSFPNDTTVECTVEGALIPAVASDACGGIVNVAVTQTWTPGACEPQGVLERIFVATDAAGNTTTGIQLLAVVDTTPPVFTFVPDDVSVDCTEWGDVPVVWAEAEDACSQATVTFDDVVVADDGNGNVVVARTFTAVDDCGNAATVTQTLTSGDTAPPTLLAPLEDLVVECGQPLPETTVEAEDNCSDVTVGIADEVVNTSDCAGGDVLRTVTLTDASGNATTEQLLIDIVDTTAPAWTSFPENVQIGCSDDVPLVDPVAEDACDSNVALQLTLETLEGDAAGNFTLLYHYVATDACGNAADSTWTVQVVDLAPPTLVVPEDVTVACDQPTDVQPPAVDDACGTVMWNATDSIAPGDCPGEHTIFRTYTATDDAGNTASSVQVVAVVDTAPPVFITSLDTLWWNCEGPHVLDTLAVTDACSEVALSAQMDTLAGDGAYEWTLQVVWTATDACGNAATSEHVILVQDLLAPSFTTLPQDTVLNLGSSLPLDQWLNQLSATDNCANAEELDVTYAVDTLDILDPCTWNVHVLWTATDPSGNAANHLQLVTLVDTVAPAWVQVPEDALLACDEVWEAEAPEIQDFNDATWTATLDTLAGNCPASFTVHRTLTAADVCGNEAPPSLQIVQFTDTVAPSLLSVPADVMVDDAALLPACGDELVTWEDTCSDADVTCDTDTVEVYCPGSFLLSRTFTVNDACGNSSAHVQSLLVEDVAPPLWVDFPADVLLSCDSLAEPWEPATLAVTDNASSGDDLLVVMVESATEGDGCSWATTTVYEAMDGCGNSVQQTHVMAWVDSTAPSLTAPLEPMAFICASDVPSCEDMLVPGTDDCNPWTWTCEETLSEPCTPNNCALVRTVTLTDACGNASAYDVDITIEEPPIDPELPTGFSPNNDNYNDVYLIANVGPEGGTPPCEWLEGTRLIVFDRWGSLVFESTDVTEPWDGTNLQGRPLPVGTYFVVFETNGATYRATVDLRR